MAKCNQSTPQPFKGLKHISNISTFSLWTTLCSSSCVLHILKTFKVFYMDNLLLLKVPSLE